MSEWQLKTTVVFIIFKRPDTTEKVFEAIRQAKPPKLLVIADGPRADKPGEAEKCAAARAIIDRVDWDCEVLKNYSDVNMGCKLRVSSGLDWVFDTVEEAIILEDDCLPHPTFFRFCEELLEKYRDDERIMAICGTNVEQEWKSNLQSYHFSYYGSLWGWASWKRAWKYYDINMKLWSNPEVQNRIKDVLCDMDQYKIRKERFDRAYDNKIDAWGPRWLFACLSQSGLSVVPSGNLIANIGFGQEATHTKYIDIEATNLPLKAITFPLINPCGLGVDRDYDRQLYQKWYKKKSLPKKFFEKLTQLATNIENLRV